VATRSECAGASTHLLSPRIAALHGELERGDAALERFWRQVEADGTPLVERIEGDDGHVLVTLLWRGDDATRNVVAETPFDTGDPDECQMTRLPGTDVWYRLVPHLPRARRPALL
jgi:hypothetical protein